MKIIRKITIVMCIAMVLSALSLTYVEEVFARNESSLKVENVREDATKTTESVVVDNVTFELSLEDKTAVLTDGKAAAAVYNVPSQITVGTDTYTVTEIASEAFYNNEALVSVTLPETVTIVGQCAFTKTSLTTFHIPAALVDFHALALTEITTLESVTVDEDNPYYTSKDGVLYTKTYSHLVTYPGARKDSSYEVDSRTDVILGCAIKDNMYLKELVLNARMGLDSFGTAMLQRTNIAAIRVPEENTQLKSIDGVLYTADEKRLILYPPAKEDKIFFVPSTVEIIGYDGYYYTFETLQYLEELYIPASVKDLNGIAWQSESLKKVIFASESQVQTLPGGMFDACTYLENICLPKSFVSLSTENWYGNEFMGCLFMDSFYVAQGAPFYTEGTWGQQSLHLCGCIVYGHGTNNKLSEMAEQFGLAYVDVSEGHDVILGITFEDTVMSIEVGESKNVNAVVYPETAKSQKLYYESSDTSVATVSSDGTVTALRAGECIITASSMDRNEEYARCKITVTNTNEIEDGLHQSEDGIWYYYLDGEVAAEYTGLVEHYGAWYYVENGVLNWSYTGLTNYGGTWYYVEGGVLNWNYTGLTEYYGTWYYVEGGVLNWGYTGLVNHYGTWYYVEGGILNWGYTGLTEYYGTWYYVEGGVLNFGYTGLVNYYGTWYYVEGGVLNWGYTGLTNYGGTWYYVEGGVLNWGYTGLTNYGGTWYYVEGGVLNWGYTGLTCYGGTWYYVGNGVLDWTFTGVVEYGGSLWYVENGIMVGAA